MTSFTSHLLPAVTLGLCVAIPFGPIGLMCVQRTLAFGIRIGVASGMGAATAPCQPEWIGPESMNWHFYRSHSLLTVASAERDYVEKGLRGFVLKTTARLKSCELTVNT